MPTDQKWLRERLEELERIDRPSASDGERQAAEWLVARGAALGAAARIEAEPAHGTYWWPLGLGPALAALGAVGAAGSADDFPARPAPPAPRPVPAHHLQRPRRPGRGDGIWLFPNLRLRSDTDGLESLAAGYETVVICSCTDLKQPANYHWAHDLAENVDFGTVADGIRHSEAASRRLGQRWL